MGYMPKELALQALRNATGQDFGYDRRAWEKWLDENPSHLTPSIYDKQDGLLKTFSRFIKKILGLQRDSQQPDILPRDDDPIYLEARKLAKQDFVSDEQLQEGLYRAWFRLHGERANIPREYMDKFLAEIHQQDKD